jgi:hypothetical protein
MQTHPLGQEFGGGGATCTPKELLRRAYGRAYDVDALIEYLWRKFLA